MACVSIGFFFSRCTRGSSPICVNTAVNIQTLRVAYCGVL